MSFPTYKDFDKSTSDALNDDFDTKFSLKVKAAAPAGVSLTTTTDLVCGASAFPTKLSAKWAHASGFSVDKLEMSGCGSCKLETSLDQLSFAPGLKLEFKGVCAPGSTGSLGLIYKHALATGTLASDVDAGGPSTLRASVLGGAGGITAGGSVQLGLGGKGQGKPDLQDFSAALGWAPRAGIFAGLQANKKASEFRAALQYQLRPDLTVSALADFMPASSAHLVSSVVSYRCCPSTSLKIKVGSAGSLAASVKHDLPSALSLVGAASVDLKNPQAFALGLTATLG